MEDMTLQEKIEKLINKIKGFDMKLGQFEKRLTELETKPCFEQEEIEYPKIPNAAETMIILEYIKKYMFGESKPWIKEEEPEKPFEIKDPILGVDEPEEEEVSEEVLELIDEVTEGE